MAELSTLARPYAKAIFELAQKNAALGEWSAQLAAIGQLVAAPAVVKAMSAPGVAKADLAAALLAAAKDSLAAGGQNVLKLLVENRRLAVVPALIAQFEAMRREAEAQAGVAITTAALIGDAEKAKLAAAVGKKLNRTVDIAWSVDESLIAGALIRAGDLVIDGSAKGELERMQIALAR